MTDVVRQNWTHYVRFDSDDAGPLLEAIVRDPDRFFVADGGIRVLKHDGTTTVVLIERDDRRWVGKRYNTKSWVHAVRRCFKPSRAAVCWRMAREFADAGIRTARPVLMIEKRLGPLRARAYYVYEYVAGEALPSVLEKDTGTRETMEKIAAMFARMARHGIVHGDMKATNILIDSGEPVLVDLDAARVLPSGERFRRAYVRDRTRFLRNWIDRPGLQRRLAALIPGHPDSDPD